MASSSDTLLPFLQSLARAPERRLLTGATVGRYAVGAMLGSGGMSTVYRARDVQLDRAVALKLLHADAASPDGLARFGQEARTLAALSHPNVVGIHDVGEHDGMPFLALELLDGETVRQRLRRGPLDVATAVARAVEILAALAAAHAHGIVHRDLKPENLFLTATGGLKVLDFGLAKRMPAATGATATSLDTADGVFLGTYAYMAPEQIRGEPVDARTDLFAFGAVLHELMTGEVAFAAPTSVETMHRILADEVAALDELVPAVPPALAAVVERCLARRPADRFASATEVTSALAAVTAEGRAPRRTARTVAPQTRYARAGDVHIGYQVLGAGPQTLVVVPGFVSNIEGLWEDPDAARFYRRLADGVRVVLFDKRGTGLSDRVAEPRAETIEHRVDDVRVVMDDAGIDRAVLLGVSEGAPIAIRFAVTFPERVAALALYGGYAAYRPHAGMDAVAAAVRDGWGTGRTLDWFAPSVAADPGKRRWWGRWERLGASPGAAAVQLDVLTDVDVTAILDLVRVPTLVAHRTGDRIVPVGASRYLAARIPGARLLERPGDDHLIVVGDADQLADDVLAFAREAPATRADRVCAAILATSADDAIRVPSLDVALAAALAARTAALHVDTHPTGSARALACARAVAAAAAPGDLLVTADVRGLICDRGFALEDRGVHALGTRVFALRRR